MFSSAICRTPGIDFAKGLTTAGLGTPDYDTAVKQHEKYVDTLRSLGLEVEVLPPLTGMPDATFVEDTAVVTEEIAVITRPGAKSREGETESIARALSKCKKITRIEKPGATIDGGDVLQMGNDFFVGLSSRTTKAGFDEFAAALAPFNRYTVTAVPMDGGLHLKSSVTQIGPDTLIITEKLARQSAFARYQKIVIPAEEEYGANTLLINGRLIMSEGHPEAARLCRDAGCKVILLNMSEFKKMDGALTCLSLRF